jgi:hypothetical protein
MAQPGCACIHQVVGSWPTPADFLRALGDFSGRNAMPVRKAGPAGAPHQRNRRKRFRDVNLVYSRERVVLLLSWSWFRLSQSRASETVFFPQTRSGIGFVGTNGPVEHPGALIDHAFFALVAWPAYVFTPLARSRSSNRPPDSRSRHSDSPTLQLSFYCRCSHSRIVELICSNQSEMTRDDSS